MIKILFVCTGNICRSPTADGILRARIAKLGLQGMLEVDSAGVSGYHAGERPDARSQHAAHKRGYDLSALTAREVVASDFVNFDYIFALDRGHYAALLEKSPEHAHAKIKLFLPFVGVKAVDEVPDPYYGGEQGFEHVLDILEESCENLLNRLLDEMDEENGCVSHGACGCTR
jgi:protein-tyrosine phosphatase